MTALDPVLPQQGLCGMHAITSGLMSLWDAAHLADVPGCTHGMLSAVLTASGRGVHLLRIPGPYWTG